MPAVHTLYYEILSLLLVKLSPAYLSHININTVWYACDNLCSESYVHSKEVCVLTLQSDAAPAVLSIRNI